MNPEYLLQRVEEGQWTRRGNPPIKQFSCYSFEPFPLTQNCYFGAPGHRTKSWGFESIWTHGGREKKGGKMGLQAKTRAIKSHALYCIRRRISCEYSFTLVKLQSAELTLKRQVKVTTVMKTEKVLVHFYTKKKKKFYFPPCPFLIPIALKPEYFMYF